MQPIQFFDLFENFSKISKRLPIDDFLFIIVL
jgi:hypothetical protein